MEMAQSIQRAIPKWQLKDDLRQSGKTLNFAILYQMQEQTLARQLGCPLEMAGSIIRDLLQPGAESRCVPEVGIV